MALTRASDKIIANADGNLNLSGIVTASSFRGDGSQLTGIDASTLKNGSDTKAQANASGVVVTGVLTATSYSGDGSNLTNLPAGLGTALSSTQTSPLNKLYYTNEVLSIASTITVDHPATGTGAYTQYADLRLEEDADLIIADGDDVIPNILGLGTDGGGLGAGGSGRIRVDQITNKNANGAPNFTNGLTGTTGTFTGNLNVGGVLTYEDVTNVDSIGIVTARLGINLVGNDLNVGSNIKIGNASGIVTATSFSGSGANLTSLPAANLTGTLPAISGANLTGLTSGITMIDSWSITSNFTQSAGHTEVTANWRRNYAGSTYWGVLGSAMTESSGVFSFPATGIYLVQFNFHGRSNGSAQSYIGARLFVSQNAGVGYGQMAFNYSQAYASQAHFNCSNSAILDVTNISNTKFRFNTEVQSSTIWFGETNAPKIGSGFYVIRLGDT